MQLIGFIANGSTYYYVRNVQGDIIKILDGNMEEVVEYKYDTWGRVIGMEGSDYGKWVGSLNPFRYRGYYYDDETGMYYLQSRYYNPEWGRFLNADISLLGNVGASLHNLYAYASNNPVVFSDPAGMGVFYSPGCVTYTTGTEVTNYVTTSDGVSHDSAKVKATRIEIAVKKVVADVMEDIKNFDKNNQSEEKTLESNYFSAYKGVPVVRIGGNRSGSFGAIFLTRETNNRDNPDDVLRHEYGHTKQLKQLGAMKYAINIGIPSALEIGGGDYYSRPWEITADIYGGVQSRHHADEDIKDGFDYLERSNYSMPFVWIFME